MKFFSLIYQGDIHTSDDTKVIRAEDFSTLLSADEVLKQAKMDAIEYKKQIDEESQKIRQAADERGFNEGLERFNEHLIQFDKQVSLLRMELQKQILPLALKAAKKIVADQLTLKPDTLVDIVIQTLTPVLQNHRFVIYVNKQDKELLEAHRPRIRAILEHVQSLSIQERADISAGGCIIETESGIINASIENQWRALETAFDRYMKK